MSKMKTHRAAAKRFRYTGSGKVRRNRTNKSHKLEKKTSRRKRRLGRPAVVSRADAARVKRLLPYG